jgi:signal transduction histidine kinase
MKSQPLEMQFKDTKVIFQVRNQIISRYQTGIVLYISKSIIEAHGERIWPENNIGRGSTFIFTLPLVNGD